MSFLEIMRTASRALQSNKLRTALSILGIVIGVASVIALVSVGTGAQVQITSRISGLGSHIITISPAATRGRAGQLSRAAEFTYQLAHDITQAAPGVKHVIPQQQSNGLLIYGTDNLQAAIVGTTPGFTELMNYHPLIGRFIRDRDVEEEAFVAVLGSAVAQDLFEDVVPVGETITIGVGNRRLSFTIIGVMESKGQVGFTNFDNQVFIPITTLLRRMSGSQVVQTFQAEPKEGVSIAEAVSQIEYYLMRRLGSSSSFRVTNQQSILETLNEASATFTMMLGAIASISLLVGGIGIMNIMLVSVTERTREIGIRKAVGALQRDLRFQFLVEAIFLSFVGGLLGIGLGWIGSRLIAHFGNLPAVVSWTAVSVSLGFSIAVGLIFGVYPAYRASKLDPVVALRHQ